MVTVIWTILMWATVFILVPINRIKQLWPVIVISFLWLFVLDYIFIKLEYYYFSHNILVFKGVPLIYLLGGSAGGLLMMNWMPKRPLYKILVVSFFSGLLSLSAYVFDLLGAFTTSHGYTQLLNFVFNCAGLSFLVWLSLEVVGEEKIYQK